MIVYNVVHDTFRGPQSRNIGAYHYGGAYMHHGGGMPLRRPRYENGNGYPYPYPCCSCGYWADPTC